MAGVKLSITQRVVRKGCTGQALPAWPRPSKQRKGKRHHRSPTPPITQLLERGGEEREGEVQEHRKWGAPGGAAESGTLKELS